MSRILHFYTIDFLPNWMTPDAHRFSAKQRSGNDAYSTAYTLGIADAVWRAIGRKDGVKQFCKKPNNCLFQYTDFLRKIEVYHTKYKKNYLSGIIQ